MYILIIGFTRDTIHVNMKCTGIKACYLLSSGLRTGGSIHSLFMLDDLMRQFSIEYKIKYIKEHDKDKSADFDELLEQHGHIMKLARKKIRYRESKHISMQKQLEKSIDNYFEIILKENLAPLEQSGMYELRKLFDNPAFAYYDVKDTEPEKEDNDFGPLSNLLMLDLDELDSEKPFLLFLNYDFLSDAFSEYAGTALPTDTFSDNGFLAPLLSLGNINLFSIADIDLVKAENEFALSKFQQAVSDFVSVADTPQKSFDIFNTNTLPASKHLQQTFDSTTHFNNINKTGTAIINIYAGLVPSKTVYKYFEFTKAATDETLKVVNAYPQTFLPVIVLQLPSLDNNIPGLNQQPTSLSTKKSLDIN